MIQLHTESHLAASRLHQMRQIKNRELLRKLIEHAELAFLGGIQAGQFNASHRVSNIEEAARLPTFTVDGERLSNRSLHAEAIQNGSEHLVVVETINERFIKRDLRRAALLGCSTPLVAARSS